MFLHPRKRLEASQIRGTQVSVLWGPLLLLAVYSLTYPFMPSLVDKISFGQYCSFSSNLQVYAPHLLASTAISLSISILIYEGLSNRLRATGRMVISVPAWPLCTFLVFELNRGGAEFSEICVYFMVVLSLLAHFCAEIPRLQLLSQNSASQLPWDSQNSWRAGLFFSLSIIVVPPLFLMARLLGIHSKGPDLKAEWLSVGTFSAFALLFCLVTCFLYLRIPNNVFYLMQLPAQPVSAFISYSEVDSGSMIAVRGTLKEHRIIAHAYELDMFGAERIEAWVETKIEISHVVIVLISNDSLQSPWVLREVRIARKKRKPILPLAVISLNELKAWDTTLGKIFKEVNIIHADSVESRMAKLSKAILANLQDL